MRSDERPAQNLLLLLTTCRHLYELCNNVWVVNCKFIHFLQIQIDCQHINYDLRQHNMEAFLVMIQSEDSSHPFFLLLETVSVGTSTTVICAVATAELFDWFPFQFLSFQVAISSCSPISKMNYIDSLDISF